MMRIKFFFITENGFHESYILVLPVELFNLVFIVNKMFDQDILLYIQNIRIKVLQLY